MKLSKFLKELALMLILLVVGVFLFVAGILTLRHQSSSAFDLGLTLCLFGLICVGLGLGSLLEPVFRWFGGDEK